MKHYVVYWTSTGNTQVMAETLGESLNTQVNSVEQASKALLDSAEIIYLGASAMGCEEVDGEMMDFVKEHADLLAAKKIVLFGSYDWGDGEWLSTWETEMISIGAKVLGTLKIQNTPDADGIKACEALAKSLSV